MEDLPDDLVRKCLLKVPYKSHNNLKAVCRSWKAMVSSPTFYADRKISGTSEKLLCFIQPVLMFKMSVFVVTVYDPMKDTWERLPFIDHLQVDEIPIGCECVAVNRKLILVGGFHPCSNRRMQRVYIYDFESARWSRGAHMPTPRHSFAFSVDSSTGLVYVAGGTDKDFVPLAAAESYNVEENKWEILPPMIQPHGIGCHGVFMEGKFMVLSGGEDKSAEIFDPSAGTWRRWENMSFRGDLWGNGNLSGKCVAFSSGELYAFSEEQQQVMKYDGEKNVWTAVASIPQSARSVNCVAQFGDWIFVGGGNLWKSACYLFHPSTGQWIEVKGGVGDGGCCQGMVAVVAATVEI
jgi:hypothetical protein